jgi:hypothetical protein
MGRQLMSFSETCSSGAGTDSRLTNYGTKPEPQFGVLEARHNL